MISLTDAQINTWLITLIWPLSRVLGLLMVAPLFGHSSIPVRVKIGLGIFTTMIFAPTLPPMPNVELASMAGLFILVQQLVVGLAIGFIMSLCFAAIQAAGEIMGLQMGLGFATFFDPNSAGNTMVISQFLNILAILIFLSVNGHLLMLSALVESFTLLPISAQPLAGVGIFNVLIFGSTIFTVGLKLALPLIAVLLMTNLALGILTRSAPQLNIFAIGFPITLGVGLITLDLSLPYLSPQFEHLFQDGIRAAMETVNALNPSHLK